MFSLYQKIPLHLAAGEGHLDIVRYLVKRNKAYIKKKDIFGVSTLLNGWYVKFELVPFSSKPCHSTATPCDNGVHQGLELKLSFS